MVAWNKSIWGIMLLIGEIQVSEFGVCKFEVAVKFIITQSKYYTDL